MTEHIPYDIDLLDFLRTQLGDLSGFGTLANELIQNAEDAKASEILFDVTDDNALIVRNDSQFSDKDFNNIQKIAGGGKRNEEEWTIGKFGIGFTSVYLITDRPVLISSGRRYVFKPEEPSIEPKEEDSLSNGTCFILPWAKNNSYIRQKLDLLPITSHSIDQFIEEVQEALPKALLFLKNLKKITLKAENRSITVTKKSHNDLALISSIEKLDGQINERYEGWYFINGDFTQQSKKLKEEYGKNKYGNDKIEQKRKADVSVAIPEQDQDLKGLFYAFLPTQESTTLPFHINADFFPSSDRKRISWDNDHRGKWNETAWTTAVSILANKLEDLKQKLGHQYLWKILSEAKRQPYFWKQIKDKLPYSALIWTTTEEWVRPHEAFLLKSFPKEKRSLQLLQSMGLSIVHPDLGSHSFLLSKDVGVSFLDATVLANKLISLGLNHSLSIEEAPHWIRSESNRHILGLELEVLLARKQFSSQLEQVKRKISQCAIALGHDGKLHPINSLYPAVTQNTLQLFIELDAPLVFLTNENPSSIKKIISEHKLTKYFTADVVVTALQSIPRTKLRQPGTLSRLFQWLDEKQNCFSTEEVKSRLCNLPIFPSGGNLVPLTGLLVPGSFSDPLHLAKLVDLEATGGHRELLINLGARELTLVNYVRYQIPSAFKQQIDEDAKRKLIQLLANKLDEFRSDTLAKSELSQCPLVECQDGEFRLPSQVYFDSKAVQNILGSEHPLALIAEDNKKSVRKLLSWLGVENKPRPAHIISAIKQLIWQSPTEPNKQIIQNIFIYLNEHWSSNYQTTRSDFGELRTLRWLPAQRDHYQWYLSDCLYTDENSVLFFTQAQFLEIPDTQLNSDFIEFLDIQRKPRIKQVVDHLLTCSTKCIGISHEVYQFLQEHINDLGSDLLSSLREADCIYIGNKEYLHPRQVFWNCPDFEPYRYSLKPSLRPFTELFTQLGVQEYPNSEDAISVLHEVSEKYTQTDRFLSEEDRSIVVKCWELLSEALEKNKIRPNTIAEALQDRRVVVTEQKALKTPQDVFFKDRPNLAKEFPVLEESLITKLKFLSQYQALLAAGVRPLSQVITTELIDREHLQAEHDDQLDSTIKRRRYLLKRVIVETQLVNNFVNQLIVKQAKNIRIRYSLTFNSQVEPQTKGDLAYLEKTDDQFVLYYCRQNGVIPWAHIAREIAYAFDLDAEAGQVASALKEVISAESEDDASDILDALGFAPGTEAPPRRRQRHDEASQPDSLTPAPSQSSEDQDEPSGTPQASGTAKTDPATASPEIAEDIGKWAKKEAKKFYSSQDYMVDKSGQTGFDFKYPVSGLPDIKVKVKAITFDRPNIRFTMLEWTALANDPDGYELLIISHKNKVIKEVIQIKKVWQTLITSLSRLKAQRKTSVIYNTEDSEVLLGFQQNSDGDANDILLNWHRIFRALPQENVTKYRQTPSGFEVIS